MSLPQAAANIEVQMARIAAGLAEVHDDVVEVRTSQQTLKEEWGHYSLKIEEIHRAVFLRNGLMERMAVLEATSPLQHSSLEGKIESSSEVAGIQTGHVKESSIDWKFIAMLLINLVIVVLVARMTS